MAGRMRKSQTAWARREHQGQWRRRLGGSGERKEARGAALGEAKVRERTGEAPGILQTSRMTVTLVDVPMEGLTQVSGVV